MSLSAIQAVEVLRAAGEPTRLRILALLSIEELAVAGLVDRFPDGAWVFYGLVAGGLARRLADETLASVDPADPILLRDAERLQAVRAERSAEAGEYFARNAARWDEIRSLYVSETAVEAAVLKVAGPGPFKRLVDLGSGTGRMLTLLGPHAEAAVGLDLSQQMLNIARNHVAEAGLERCELRHGDIFGTR